MQIKIGIQNINREISLDVSENPDDIHAHVREALDHNQPLILTDKDGSTVVVPAGMLGYVQTIQESPRHVGFGFAE
ncbi:MAG: DUF3107 domain-containing protein [Actinomycetaceae bacterium]|nr:DUF3107 domain-containing protein [Actinomycetaceae bacterium]MDY6082390.1 DUF3107 domain-containing protein [Actinomycetaceae bacterium]